MGIPPWKEAARRMLPELEGVITEAETPYLLWFDLRFAFERAYQASPRNESLIGRIYAYSDRCARASRGKTAEDDLLTCVSVCFFEHIPEHPAAREDMPAWFTLEELHASRGVFSYQIGDQGFAALERHFREHPDKNVPRPIDIIPGL